MTPPPSVPKKLQQPAKTYSAYRSFCRADGLPAKSEPLRPAYFPVPKRDATKPEYQKVPLREEAACLANFFRNVGDRVLLLLGAGPEVFPSLWRPNAEFSASCDIGGIYL
jgi:hypothetical protein